MIVDRYSRSIGSVVGRRVNSTDRNSLKGMNAVRLGDSRRRESERKQER